MTNRQTKRNLFVCLFVIARSFPLTFRDTARGVPEGLSPSTPKPYPKPPPPTMDAAQRERLSLSLWWRHDCWGLGWVWG
jgi:hypothetical protein